MVTVTPVSAAESRGYKVTDPVGRTVVVPNEPRRVVALAPSVTEIIFSLGREDRLAGVTRFSDYPPAAKDLPKVGSYVHLDVERIAALAPDLCIGIRDGNPLSAITQLDALGIPVFAVDPRDLGSVMDSVTTIGRLVNARARAQAIVDDMQRRIGFIRGRIADANHKPKVFFQIGVSPIVSVGSATYTNQLIDLAGGVNLSAGATTYPRYSKEQVIGMAPDIMVISSMARQSIFEKVKAEWEQWPAIPAVRNHAIFIAPTNYFDRPTPRLVEGLELLARLIHPELFHDPPKEGP